MAKKKFINSTKIEGFLYQYKLESKVSGQDSKNPGTPFISGTVDVATDNQLVNIVTVHFTYVTPTFAKSGKENSAYKLLMDMIDGKYASIMKDGADKAVKITIDSAIGLNEFYSDRDGKEELVSAKRNEGGFIHITNEIADDENKRNTFECDMIITKVTLQEANEERNLPEKAVVRGTIFDFRGSLLPVEFSAVNPHAIDYFVGLGASSSNPTFTKVKGQQISETIVRTITEEGAFGEPSVREIKNTRKDFVITWAAQEPYEWDTEETLLVSELKEKMAERETHLATIKKRQDNYKNSQGKSSPASKPAHEEFDF